MSWKRLTDLPPSVLAIALVLLLLAGVLMLRPVWLRLLGPVFVAESDRVARKGRVFLIRVLFGLSLLGVLYFVYPEERPLPPNEREHLMQEFAREFTQVFLIAQSIVVLLLTPIYMSGAISEEKERRSLDFLLGTQLSSSEIVLGKLFSRMLPLLGLALTSLPVLAMTQLWGGVDLPRVLAGCGALVFSVLSLSALSVLCSVLSRRTLPALGATYAIYIAANLVCLAPFLWDNYTSDALLDFLQANLYSVASPIGFQIRLEEVLDEKAATSGLPAILAAPPAADSTFVIVAFVTAYGILHVAVATVFLGIGSILLRRMSARGLFSYIPVPSMTVRKRTADGETIVVVRRKLQTYVPLPRMGRWPLVWKECHVGKTVLGGTFHDLAWMLLGTIVLVLGVFGAFVVNGRAEQGISEVFGSIIRVVMVLAGTFLMLGIGLNLSGSVTRERERQTLDGLLALPIQRTGILRAKILGAIYRQRRPLAVLVFTVPMALLVGLPHAAAWLLLPTALFVHIAFASSLGLYLSNTCRSTVRANVTLILILVSLVAGSWLVGYLAGQWDDKTYRFLRDESPAYVFSVPNALNPIQSWWRISASRYEESDHSWRVDGEDRWTRDAVVCGIVLGVFFLASILLYFLAHQHFRWRARHG